MELKYKPTKQKEKKEKAPKEPKVEKPIKLGSAQKIKISKPAKSPKTEKNEKMGDAVKLNFKKPKEGKEPKISTNETQVSIKPEKIEKIDKVEKFKSVGNFKIPTSPKFWIIVGSTLVVLVAIVIVMLLMPKTEVDPLAPNALVVDTTDAKTLYYVGEVDDFSGLKLKMLLNNGAEISVNLANCEILGFDSSAPADNQTITVKYKDLQTTFAITVKKLITDTPTGKYTGITFKTLPKTEYKVGEWLDPTGGVLLVHYDDGTVREIPLSGEYIYEFSTDNPGEYTVVVKYVETGIYGETSYKINISPKSE